MQSNPLSKMQVTGDGRRKLAFVATIWVTIAILGYALGLKQHAKFLSDPIQGPGVEVTGRVDKISFSGFFNETAWIKLKDDPRDYYLPRFLLTDPSAWDSIKSSVKSGANVYIKYVYPNNPLIISFTLNAGTAFPKTFCHNTNTVPKMPYLAPKVSRIADFYLLLGICFFPVVWAYSKATKRFLFRKPSEA